MGEVTIIEEDHHQVIIRSVFHFYGNAADEEISKTIADDIASQWNEPAATILLRKKWYAIRFIIEGYYRPELTSEEVFTNTDPVNNYFRIENFAAGNISFVDGIGSNTGYFLRENILHILRLELMNMAIHLAWNTPVIWIIVAGAFRD